MVLWLLACSPLPAERELLPVQWIADRNLPREKAEQALHYTLYSLGGVPTEDAVTWISEDRFLFDVDGAGLPQAAVTAVVPVLDELAASEERAVRGAVDLGRLLTLLRHDPERYYQATAACQTLDGFVAREMRGEVLSYVVTSSQVQKMGRRRIAATADLIGVSEIAMMVADGAGTMEAGTFTAHAFETFDLLENGMGRFAVYDENGQLLTAHETVGAPGNCQWCHEGRPNLGRRDNASVGGALKAQEWQALVARVNAAITERQAALDTVLWVDEHEVHDWAEQTVEGFLWPSPDRLAQEWGVSEEQVQRETAQRGLLYSDAPPEFWVWGYPRASVDGFEDLSGFAAISVPASSRRSEIRRAEGVTCP